MSKTSIPSLGLHSFLIFPDSELLLIVFYHIAKNRTQTQMALENSIVFREIIDNIQCTTEWCGNDFWYSSLHSVGKEYNRVWEGLRQVAAIFEMALLGRWHPCYGLFRSLAFSLHGDWSYAMMMPCLANTTHLTSCLKLGWCGLVMRSDLTSLGLLHLSCGSEATGGMWSHIPLGEQWEKSHEQRHQGAHFQ